MYCLTRPQVEAAPLRFTRRRLESAHVAAEIFPGCAPGSEPNGWMALAGGPNPSSIATDQLRQGRSCFRIRIGTSKRSTSTVTSNCRPTKRSTTVCSMRPIPNLDAFCFARRQAAHVSRLERSTRSAPQKQRSTTTTATGRQRQSRPPTPFVSSWPPGWRTAAVATGPNTFDMVGALEQWVEQRKKPARLHRVARVDQRRVDRTRPLCPYPQVASYTGSGSVDDAANFVCRWSGSRFGVGRSFSSATRRL